MGIKRILEMDEEAWNLLKSLASFKKCSSGEAAQYLIKKYLSKAKEALSNV